MTRVTVGGRSSVSQTGTIRQIGTYAGEFAPASGLPTTGTGRDNAILKGDYWKASGSGTIASLLPFTDFVAGDLIYATKNNASVVADFFGNKASGGSGAGVQSVSGDVVDNTDPTNPVISAVPLDFSGQSDAAVLSGPELLTGLQSSSNVKITADQIAVLSQNTLVVQKTSSATLALSDMEPRMRIVQMTVATANNLTVPKDIFPLGQWIGVFWDDAQTTIVAATDVTVTPSAGGLILQEANTIYWLYQVAANEWLLQNGSESDIIEFTESSGTAIKFDSPRKYGTIASPRTGSVTFDTTGYKTNVCQLLIHNHSSDPVLGGVSGFTVIAGEYVTSVNNFILLLSIESGEVLVTISQEV